MTEKQPIGRIRTSDDPDPTLLSYVTNQQEALNIGEFVYYPSDPTKTDNNNKVLCRITQRLNLKHVPDDYYVKPQLDPSDILEFTGGNGKQLNDYQVQTKILGRCDVVSGFNVPRCPTPVGKGIYLAEDTYLEEVLNRVPYQSETKKRVSGGINAGSLLDRIGRVKVVLDADKILSTHLAIMAATGQGKSYTTGVIIEELLMPHNRAPVLILDMHGEYSALKDVENHPEFKDGDYQAQVDCRNVERIKIPFDKLTVADISGLIGNLTDPMRNVLNKAYRLWREDNVLTKTAFRQAIQHIKDGDDSLHEASVMALLSRFDLAINDRPYFVDSGGEKLSELIRPGCATVLNLSNISGYDQVGLCKTILSLVLKARQQTELGNTQEGDFFHLDYPTLVVAEEVHRIAPAGGGNDNTLATILSEGRKFGIGVICVSQRPGKIDSNVLSQCLNQIIGRITNPVDQGNIRDSAEGASDDLLKLLPSLATGEAVIFGHVVRTPLLIRIRKRLTSDKGDHGSPIAKILAAEKLVRDAQENQVEIQPQQVPQRQPRQRIGKNNLKDALDGV